MKKKHKNLAQKITPAALGLSTEKYETALRYLFDRPVPVKGEQEWYWNIDEPEFDATPLEWTRIQTVLYANAGADLAPYCNEQVGMGLNHVMSNNAGDIPHAAVDRSVPLEEAMRMMAVFPQLWQDCIGPRLAHSHTAIGSGDDGRLGFVCYMWFDVWPTFWCARDIPQWQDAMWNVLCAMLDVPCRAVQIAALHGLGHEGHYLNRPRMLEAQIDAFIQPLKGKDAELERYARIAKTGMVQ